MKYETIQIIRLIGFATLLVSILVMVLLLANAVSSLRTKVAVLESHNSALNWRLDNIESSALRTSIKLNEFSNDVSGMQSMLLRHEGKIDFV